MLNTEINSNISWYYKNFSDQLRLAAEFVQDNRYHADRIRADFPTWIEMLRNVQHYIAREWVDVVDCSLAALSLIECLGEWPRLWVNWTESEQILRFAVDLCERCANYALLAEMLNRLAGLYIDTGRIDQANETLTAALGVCQTFQLGLPFVKIMGTQISINFYAARSSDAEQMIADTEANPLFATIEATQRYIADGHLFVLRAWVHRQNGKISAAVDEIEQALHILNQANEPNLLAHAYRLAGLIYSKANQPGAAIKAYKQARRLFKARGDEFSAVWVVGNMGLTYWNTGRLDQAERAFALSAGWARKHHAHWQKTPEIGNQGLVALSQGRLTGAERFITEQLRCAETYHIDAEYWRATGNLGIVYFHQGRYDEALALLTAENAHNEVCHVSIWGRVCTYAYLGRCYAAQHQFHEALNWVQYGLSEAERINSSALQAICLRSMAEVIGSQYGPTDKAARGTVIHYLNRALALSAGQLLDRAGCYLSLAGQIDDAQKRARLWAKGVRLLERGEALPWLHHKVDGQPASPDNPPRLLMLI